MKTTNMPTGGHRVVESGLCWEEKLTNVAGTLYISPYTTFRVRAAAAVTVSINGVLAMTMKADEIAFFNTGDVNPAAPQGPIAVVVVGLCYLQVAREVEHKRQSPN